MKYRPLVSIITINYNGCKDTIELIESLQSHIGSLEWEIVVIDNGSIEDESRVIARRFVDDPRVVSFRSEENLGFAGGNNLAVKRARGSYLFFLNNDTYVESDGFASLIERMETDPSIGVVCPMIRFAEGLRPIQFAGYLPLSRYTLRNWVIGYESVEIERYKTAILSAYAHGAAMCVKREVWEKAGSMPECYFLYYEELDWSEMIKKAGFEIWYEPQCEVFHKDSRSTGPDSPLKIYHLTRNRLLFVKRNRKGTEAWLSYLFQILVASPKHIIGYLLRGRTDMAKAILKGIGNFVRYY